MFRETLIVAAVMLPLAAYAASPADAPTEIKMPQCYDKAWVTTGIAQSAQQTRGMAVFISGRSASLLVKKWNSAYHQTVPAEEVAVVITANQPNAALTFMHAGKGCSIWSMPVVKMARWLLELPDVKHEIKPDMPTPAPGPSEPAAPRRENRR